MGLSPLSGFRFLMLRDKDLRGEIRILHLRRLHHDVRNVPLSKHGIEGRDILGQELLEFLRVLLALLIQPFLHRQLLRAGRKIR